MLKRRLWSTEEDMALEKLMISQPSPPQWDTVAAQMAGLKFDKSAKQCKDRWLNNLSPLLNKNKWSLGESKELFKQYLLNGNKWKLISNIFTGRTDNAVKNQFFSVIRKSLRTMNKFLGISCNTGIINSIRPKILAELLSPESVNKKRNDLVHKFAFKPYTLLAKELNDEERLAVAECVNFAIEKNDAYISKKIQKKKAKNAFKSITTSRSSQFANTVLDVEFIPSGELSEENIKKSHVAEQSFNTPEIEKPRDENVKWIENQIKELAASYDIIRQKAQSDSKFLRRNMAEFFGKLTNLSSKIQTSLENEEIQNEGPTIEDYITSASKLLDYFQSEGRIAQKAPIILNNSDVYSDNDVLRSIHNFNRNEETDTIEYLNETIFVPKRESKGSKERLNEEDAKDLQSDNQLLNKRYTVSTNANDKEGQKESVCLYNAEVEGICDHHEFYNKTRKFSAEAFEEMFEDFEYSGVYL